MKQFALTGYPLGHSISPAIHERLFALSGKTDCSYALFPLAPEAFHTHFAELSCLSGFNVTIPHKQRVIPHLHRLDSSAELYRSVNTVQNRNGVLTGYNTDVTGFLKSTESLGFSFKGKDILILGYGGAGRMMATEAVRQESASVTIGARKKSLRKAGLFADELKQFRKNCAVGTAALETVCGPYDLIVNSTPAGMFPDVNTSPLAAEQLQNSAALFDAVYNPNETKLMTDARSCGLRVCGGMTMLVWQAAAAHKIWYGASFSNESIAALIQEMEEYILHNFNQTTAQEK